MKLLSYLLALALVAGGAGCASKPAGGPAKVGILGDGQAVLATVLHRPWRPG